MDTLLLSDNGANSSLKNGLSSSFNPLEDSSLGVLSQVIPKELSLSSVVDNNSIEQMAKAISSNSNLVENLVVSPTLIPDRAGNTPATARQINGINNRTATRSFNDFVGSSDPDDYYRFTLTRTHDIDITLSGLSNDADVQLLRSDGTTVITGSYNGGTLADTITRQLNAGDYYIRVFQYSGDTNYNLDVSAVPRDLAGNTPATARQINGINGGVTTRTRSFNDFVGSVDTNDYYRFTLTNTHDVDLLLSGLSNDADLLLLDSNQNVIDSSTYGGTISDSITSQLTAGTYYIRVYQYSGDTNYNLTVSAVLS